VVPTVKAEAATMCADRKFWGEPRPDCSKVDPNSTVIDDSNKGFFYPCDVALRTPVCGAADDDGGEEEDEDDGENKTMMYAIGGVLAVIVVGGVGYAVMKKKKKRR